MNNPNNQNQTTQPNKELLKEIVEATNLSPEEIKQNFPNLEKEFKNDRVEPIKTTTDQEKIEAYDRLNVKDLPADWKVELARLEYLEGELSNYTKIKAELKGWTEAFNGKNSIEVNDDFEDLEIKLEKTEEELGQKITELENNLDTIKQDFSSLSTNLNQKVAELETELKDWKEIFNHQELSEVKTEWQNLQTRPDVSINENEFYDDYARRKSIQQSELETKELENLKTQLAEKDKQIQSFQQKLDTILENEINLEWILADPAITKDQAREAIEELLEKKEREWENYLKTGRGAEKLAITLTFYPQKRSLAEQVLEWIREARASHDYQKLFEKWSGGSDYNKEQDLDGSLLLLGKRLEKFNKP